MRALQSMSSDLLISWAQGPPPGARPDEKAGAKEALNRSAHTCEYMTS